MSKSVYHKIIIIITFSIVGLFTMLGIYFNEKEVIVESSPEEIKAGEIIAKARENDCGFLPKDHLTFENFERCTANLAFELKAANELPDNTSLDSLCDNQIGMLLIDEVLELEFDVLEWYITDTSFGLGFTKEGSDSLYINFHIDSLGSLYPIALHGANEIVNE